MTVIVAALTEHGKGKSKTQAITVASDTQITGGWEKTTGAYPKIWDYEGRMIFGAAGLVAAWQAVKHNASWPHYPESQDWEEWLVLQVRPTLIEHINYAGVLYQRRGVMDTNAAFIVAVGTNLASIDCVGGVVVPARNCAAIGSGYSEALGSLGDGSGPWKPKDVIKAAFNAAQINLGCGPPIYWANTIDYEVHRVESLSDLD